MTTHEQLYQMSNKICDILDVMYQNYKCPVIKYNVHV